MAKKKKSKIGKMKAYESFDVWAEDQISDWQEPIKIFRKLIKARSIRLKTKKDIDKAYITKLIRQAVKNLKD